MRTPFLAVLLALLALPAAAQSSTDWAWTPLLRHEGLDISFIFYSEADNTNNGIVIKLHNRNTYPIAYRFKVVFRTEGAERIEPVVGRLEAGEARTGDAFGLFWIPFPDGRSIGEVGIRGYRVQRAKNTGVNLKERREPVDEGDNGYRASGIGSSLQYAATASF